MESTVIIDSLEFTRASQALEGEVSVARLPRLADSLFDSFGNLNFSVRGNYDSRHRPRLLLSVKGEINLKCQRCLGRLPYAVAVESNLLILSESGPVETAEIDELDGVPANPHTDVWALVEDEVLLAIPYAARHPEGHCSMQLTTAEERAVSPFAVLAQLKPDQVKN